MGENKFMRSDPLTKGINAAPQRSLLKALGLCDAEIGKPLIGVVSSKNDIVPGHMNLDKIVDAVKQGLALFRLCSRQLPSATASRWATSA